MRKDQLDGQETETGYVTDSSVHSRAEMEKRGESDKQNVKRKTKSKRDKRSSRASVIEECSSSSETWSSLEQNTHCRYRKRAGSKKIDYDSEDIRQRKRAGSKLTSNSQRIQSFDEKALEETIQENISISTCTLKMDNKDIYYGTWNPKERAVLDQVLNNIESADEKQDVEENYVEKNSEVKKEMKKRNEKKKSSFFGRIRKAFKTNEKETGDELFPTIEEDPLQDYVFPQKKKKNIFRRLVSHNNKKKQIDAPRRRAHSTNDSSHFSARIDAMNARANLNKKRSGSTHSLKSLFNRAKSVDNLNGAFDYFANQNQIFQRTPSLTKLQCKSRTNSLENIRIDKSNGSQNKNSGSQTSLNHGFEPVKPSVKDICYDDDQPNQLIFAQTSFVEPRTASQRSVFQVVSRQSSVDQDYPPKYYDSSFSDTSRYLNGYYSDVPPSSATPTLNKGKKESYMSYSAMASCPSSCPPIRKVFRPPPPYDRPSHRKRNINHDDTLADDLTNSFKKSWNSESVTPTCVSGYNSDNELGNTPHEQHDVGNIPHEQLSMIPYHARRAIKRSLSKNSSASTYSSNYGYLSESSFCEDDEVFAISSPINSTPKKEKFFYRNEFVRTSIKGGVLSTVL